MHPFKQVIEKKTPVRMSEMACEIIKASADTDDKRSEYFTVGNAFWFQFWAHHGLDSMGEGTFRNNRYNGMQDGQGMYPERRTSALLDKQGFFRLSESGGLPELRFAGENPDSAVEVSMDGHRVNENPVLSAFHLMAVKLHNQRMSEHGDYEKAKAETIALLNRITLNESLILCDMNEREFFEGVKIEGMHQSAEFVFAIARWAHPMMPDTVNGRALFKPERSELIDLVAMFDGSEMSRVMNFGTSQAMLEMDHLPGNEGSILNRTFARHQELNLPCWQDLCEAYGLESDSDSATVCELGCPIFAGMLYEAEIYDNRPGPVLSRALADGIAQSLNWGRDTGQGLWLPLWHGAPSTTIEIIEYSLS